MDKKTMIERLNTEEQQAEIWKPQISENLIGKLIEKRMAGSYGSLLFIFETEDGLKAVWGNKALEERLKGVELNKTVGIKYLGEEISKKTKMKFKNYKVVVDL